jgi:tRNA 2-thiouridine synthesizing protein E
MDDMFDNEGFLIELNSWNEELATSIANHADIQLSTAHWEIIWLVREFYQQYDLSPANRALVKAVKQKLGEEKGNSIYLLSLFPESPAKLASKIAGLPKPANCF